MRSFFLAIFSCLFLAGCKVGPDYHPPSTIVPTEFNENEFDMTIEVEDEDLIHWWSTFNDPFLDQLLETAILQNFDYRIALEQVYQARSQYWVQFTQILPELDADSTASHFRVSRSFGTRSNSDSTPAAGASSTIAAPSASTAAVSPIQNFFQFGLAAIWEIDLFGKLRRSADASYDLWQATAAEMRGVKIIVLSEVASTYAVICSYQLKKYITEQVVSLDEELLALSQVRFEAGLAPQQELESTLAALVADKAQLSLVQAALKQAIYSLAVLLGELPETVINDFEIARPIPRAEGMVPVGLPSDLLRRRPDIQNAERQLAAATEQIGVAVASLFPSLSLTGSSSSFAANPLQGANIGFSSDSLSKLFRPASLIWGIGALVTMPVFDFGKRNAEINVQIALRNQAYYAYQKTVISALQETEQALEVYFNEERREKSLDKVVQSNWRTLSLTSDLFQAGLANYTQVMDAKEIWLASLNNLTDSQEALTVDLIAIYKALGGDW